jgi:hypothetical protein
MAIPSKDAVRERRARFPLRASHPPHCQPVPVAPTLAYGAESPFMCRWAPLQASQSNADTPKKKTAETPEMCGRVYPPRCHSGRLKCNR